MSAVVEGHEASAQSSRAPGPSLVERFDMVASAPGGVPQLRDLILSLAVQGRLVPQDENDAPASILLAQIRIEKDRFLKDGTIQRERRTATIDDSEKPFELPRGWEWARLPEISFDHGQGLPTHDFTYIDVGAIDNQRAVVTDAVEVVTASEAPSRARKRVATGTVLYSTVRPYLKNIAIVEKDYAPPAVASTAFAVLHPHTGVLGKYLLYYLRSSVFTEYVASRMVGVAYPAINDTTFFRGVVPLPPTAEQARIVSRIDELMRLCDALEVKGRLEAEQHTRLLNVLLSTLTESTSPEKLAANWQRVAEHFDLLVDRPEAVDAMEQMILQLAVRGHLVTRVPCEEPASVLLGAVRAAMLRLVDEDGGGFRKALPDVAPEERLFELPLGWMWTRIGHIATVQGGLQKTPSRRPILHHAPYLRVANVQRDSLDLREIARFEVTPDELNRWRLRAGDLLIVEGNGSELEIGRSAVWMGDIDPCVYQNHLIRVRTLKEGFVEFIQLFLNSPDGKAEMKRLATTTSGLFNLSVGKIRNFVVPLPPLQEQARIVAQVSELRRLCASLRQRFTDQNPTHRRFADALVGPTLAT